METATAESFSPKQNGSTYCSINNIQGNFDPEDDFGPETNIDNIDDGLLSQPVSTKKTFTSFETLKNNGFSEELQNNNTAPDTKGTEIDEADDKNAISDDSDDEEWNYFGGQGTNRSKSNNCQNSQLSENNMSNQEVDYSLNPDAAEFVPVSPSSVKSGDDNESSAFSQLAPDVRERLLHDDFVASSPLKGHEKSMENVEVPTLNDFDKEIRKRPSNIMPDFNADDSFGPDGDFCPIKHNDDSSTEETETVNNDTCISTKAVFGDESTYAKNLDEINKDLQEKPDDDIESSEIKTKHASDVHNQISQNGIFDNEDYPSIVERGNVEQNIDFNIGSSSYDHFSTNKDPLDFDDFSGRENKGTRFEDISSITEDNEPEGILRNVMSFSEEVQPTHTTIFMDGQPTFTSKSNTPSPIDDLLRGKSNQSSNPFALPEEAEKENAEEKEVHATQKEESLNAHDVVAQSAQNDVVDFTNEKEPIQSDVHSNNAFFEFDLKEENKPLPAEHSHDNEFEIQDHHFDNVSSEPLCTREVKAEVEASPEENAKPEEKIESAGPSEDMISSQIVDNANVDSDEDFDPQDANVTSSNTIGNAEGLATEYDAETPYKHDCSRISEKPDSVHHEPVETKHYDDLLPDNESSPEEPVNRYDAETPYVHDCSRTNVQPDSVHHEPTKMKHYDDLLPDFETSSTMESDKLESELRETEEKTSNSDMNQFSHIFEDTAKSESPVSTSEVRNPDADFLGVEDSAVSSAPPHHDDASSNVEVNEVKSDDHVEVLETVTPTAPAAELVKDGSVVERAETSAPDTEPAAELLESAAPIAAAAVAATAVAAVAATAVAADAKKEIKRSVIKKPEEKEKAKLPASKPTTKSATSTLAKTRPATTSPKVPAEPRKSSMATTTTTAARAAPAKPSLSAARPAASRTSTTATRTSTLPARPAQPASRAASAVAPKPAAPKLSSPAKTKPLPTTTTAAAKPLSNGDVSRPLTARKIAPSTTAIKKSPTDASKPSVNLSTRTSLAPKPRPVPTKSESPADKPKVSSTLTTRRPISAPSKVINKDSKDLTNKRLSATKTSPLKSSATTNGKTESKVNSGLRSTMAKTTATSPASAVKKPTTATSVNGNQSEVTEHRN